MNDLSLQHQVIHKFLLMEVRQSTHDEMSFKVGGKHFKFSIEEFALVTGLKCHGDDSTSMYNVGHCCIKHSNFRHRKNVYRKDIENAFNNLTATTRDEDVVKSRMTTENLCTVL
ncbi:Hypothetical predicted protein [Olea europaea subsp. europaea]|uniref:DUF1985 domain-containing protein n=1 Tax=Olea europaea subsp. europaea TaxID=158383 RepID=A0A8S0UND9_OLEEU|nr:Hypothetical predicted protein [Olea europaea subsp. europaea]